MERKYFGERLLRAFSCRGNYFDFDIDLSERFQIMIIIVIIAKATYGNGLMERVGGRRKVLELYSSPESFLTGS